MADVIYKKGQSTNLDNVQIKEGQILVTEDTGEMYVDVTNSDRKKINDTNLKAGSSIGSTRSVGSKQEDSSYKLGSHSMSEGLNTLSLSAASHAEGIASQSGSKAFTIIGIDKANNTYTLDSTEGLEIGDVYSAHVLYTSGGSTQSSNYGKITAINENTVTVDKLFCEDTFATADSYIGKEGYDEGKNTFTIIAKPNVGTRTIGGGAHTEGINNQALERGCHAEGKDTVAYSSWAHTEGKGTKASYSSHAEGVNTHASGHVAHTEGERTEASGYASHAEGQNTIASGQSAHVEGMDNSSIGSFSHSEGYGTVAASSTQHVQGSYNIPDTSREYADIIGNGKAWDKSNAATVDWQGNAWYAGDVYVGSTSGKNKDGGSKKVATEEYVNTNGLFSNALKGNASGKSITLNDVSPISHIMDVKVYPNLFYQNGNIPVSTVNGLTINYDANTQEFTINGVLTTNGKITISSPFYIPKITEESSYYTLRRYKTGGYVIPPAAVDPYHTTLTITDTDKDSIIKSSKGTTYDADYAAISGARFYPNNNEFTFKWSMGDVGWNPDMQGYPLQCYTAMSICNLTVVSKRNGDGTSTVSVIKNNSNTCVVKPIWSERQTTTGIYGTVITSKTDVPNNNKIKRYELAVKDSKLSISVINNEEKIEICTNLDVSDIDFSCLTFGIKSVVGNSIGGSVYQNPVISTPGGTDISGWKNLGFKETVGTIDYINRRFIVTDSNDVLSHLYEEEYNKYMDQIYGRISASASETGKDYEMRLIVYGVGTVFDNYKFKIQVDHSSGDRVYSPHIDATAITILARDEKFNIVARYTPNEDGVVEGVKSIYPTTILQVQTDTEVDIPIDCEYNRDINKAFAELTQAIISLGGNV